jgi:Tol biopolymer transport system component
VRGISKRRAWALGLGALAGLLALAAWPRPAPLPSGLGGTLAFVSDRDGADTLYCRSLPDGAVRRLTFTTEPVRAPAIAPDGTRIAFSMGGRIGVVSLPGGEVRFLTLGIDWSDSVPAWRPDGKALAVAARGRNAVHDEIHLLEIETADGQLARTPLTASRGLDHGEPRFSPDGQALVCVREDHVFRIGLADGRPQRVTTGFRKYRSPRFLPSGRLLALWTQDKQFGLDVMDLDGRNRATLAQGTAFYRSIAPSPDGRYFAAAFGYDLQFRPAEALSLARTEDVRLLDGQGRVLGSLARSWGASSHSPDWGVSHGELAVPP